MSDDFTDLLAARMGVNRMRQLEEDHQAQLRGLLLELLGVLDSLERLSAAEPANEAAGLVRLDLLQVLERQGVTALEVVGKPFEPRCAEAAGRRATAEVAAGTVVEQCSRGYLWNGELLRAARVIVAEGSPGVNS